MIIVTLLVCVVVVPSPALGQDADSVAVAPFVNVSQQASDDWIGPGILATLTNELQQRGLPVTQINPSGTAENSALVASRALSATWLVRGTYQRVVDTIRITTRVLRVDSGVVQQSRTIDGSIEDLFQLQDEIVALIGDAVVQIDSSQQVDVDINEGRTESVDTPVQTRASRRSGFGVNAARDVPRAVIYRTAEPPRIDGQLDDPVWETATHITDFVQIAPVAGAPGTDETEVWMAYDSNNLYFAFYAHYIDLSLIHI